MIRTQSVVVAPRAAVPLYDLSPYDIDFIDSWVWPTAPNTTQTIEVPSEQTFASAAAGSNRIINVAAGSHTPPGTWGSDLELNLVDTATISGAVAFETSQRIRWNGGRLVASSSGYVMSMNGASDIVLDNVYIENSGSGGGINTNVVNTNSIRRFCLINSTVLATDGSGAFWALLVRQFDQETTPPHNQDILIANCDIECSGWQGVRNQGVLRLIIVKSYAEGAALGNENWRTHKCSQVHYEDGICFGQTALNNNGGSPQMPYGAEDIKLINWNSWDTNRNILNQNDSGVNNTGSIANSTVKYTEPPGGPDTVFGISPLTDGGGNVADEWSGVVGDIDFTQIPGVTVRSDLGADHS